jgi:16S rRNA (cytosine1402-N4)-methyltransferase
MDVAISYLINPNIKEEIIVDGTLGGGSYTQCILNKISDSGKVIGIDKDINAVNYASERLKGNNKSFLLLQGNFADIKNMIPELKVDFISGIVLDLGLSSYQLNSEEGFSFLKNSLLDMRADKNAELTASDIINEYSESNLIKIFEEYGEIKNSKRLVKSIIDKRKKERILMTYDLVKTIQREYGLKNDIPYKFFSKIFQALRIAVNNELNDLIKVLDDVIDILCNGGRIVVISYHSLEDRIVKEFFRSRESETRKIKILTKKVIKPDFKEVKSNNRARSAKLRAAEVVLI